jgi:hypothetical protein
MRVIAEAAQKFGKPPAGACRLRDMVARPS